MQTLTISVEIPEPTSPDYDWLADTAMQFMYDSLQIQPYADDGDNVTDSDGDSIDDTVQSLVTALVWRMRETFRRTEES